MTTTAAVRATQSGTASASPTQQHRLARLGVLDELQRPADIFANITPNWYAAVMGTGIVAVAAASLPEQFTGLHTFAIIVWAVAAVLLVVITAATVTHWVRHGETARGHALNPVMAHFYGAPPMALMTVGAGTILLGKDVLGPRAAVDLDWALWTMGTVLGLVTAAAVPYLMFTRHMLSADTAFGGWLMPIVPPMVSASTGAILVPHIVSGHSQLTMLMLCYAMFGLSLLTSLIVITLIGYRLAVHKAGEARLVPTLWIVLGPLGQSITAANLLGAVAHEALPVREATALRTFGLVYGFLIWGFALLWAVIAGTVTARTVRDGMPFSLTWWSFTFPVGTCVTGTSALALRTSTDLFRYAAVAFYVCLMGAWLIVAARTLHGCVHGRLFR